MSAYEPNQALHLVDRKQEIYADQHRIVSRGIEFTLAAVDRLAYSATATRINGSYMGTNFMVRLGQGSVVDTFMLDSGWKDGRLEEFRAFWGGVVDLLEATVCPRLAEDAVTAIAGGGRVAFGSIVAGPGGVRSKGPFGREIPWSDVVGTEVSNIGQLRVQVQKPGAAKVKPRLSAGLNQWNAVLLPRVVAAFTGNWAGCPA